jgi:hypothetical protein
MEALESRRRPVNVVNDADADGLAEMGSAPVQPIERLHTLLLPTS